MRRKSSPSQSQRTRDLEAPFSIVLGIRAGTAVCLSAGEIVDHFRRTARKPESVVVRDLRTADTAIEGACLGAETIAIRAGEAHHLRLQEGPHGRRGSAAGLLRGGELGTTEIEVGREREQIVGADLEKRAGTTVENEVDPDDATEESAAARASVRIDGTRLEDGTLTERKAIVTVILADRGRTPVSPARGAGQGHRGHDVTMMIVREETEHSVATKKARVAVLGHAPSGESQTATTPRGHEAPQPAGAAAGRRIARPCDRRPGSRRTRRRHGSRQRSRSENRKRRLIWPPSARPARKACQCRASTTSAARGTSRPT
jgi:hypothetical protein